MKAGVETGFSSHNEGGIDTRNSACPDAIDGGARWRDSAVFED